MRRYISYIQYFATKNWNVSFQCQILNYYHFVLPCNKRTLSSCRQWYKMYNNVIFRVLLSQVGIYNDHTKLLCYQTAHYFSKCNCFYNIQGPIRFQKKLNNYFLLYLISKQGIGNGHRRRAHKDVIFTKQITKVYFWTYVFFAIKKN